MKIIYKKTILEKIGEAIAEAEKVGKVIDRIIVDEESFNWLTNHKFGRNYELKPTENFVLHRYNGVDIEPEEKETHQDKKTAVKCAMGIATDDTPFDYKKCLEELEAYAIANNIIGRSFQAGVPSNGHSLRREADEKYNTYIESLKMKIPIPVTKLIPGAWVCNEKKCPFFTEVLGDYPLCKKTGDKLRRSIPSNNYQASCLPEDQQEKP